MPVEFADIKPCANIAPCKYFAVSVDVNNSVANCAFAEVLMSWGKFKVILPVEPLTLILFVVPVRERTPEFDIVPVAITIPVPAVNAPRALPSV